MSTPIRTTIVFALASGFLALPLTELLSGFGGYPTAFKWILWLDLAIYALLLARWSRTRLLPILFPLALLLGAASGKGAGTVALSKLHSFLKYKTSSLDIFRGMALKFVHFYMPNLGRARNPVRAKNFSPPQRGAPAFGTNEKVRGAEFISCLFWQE
jgi:hypothetical protein